MHRERPRPDLPQLGLHHRQQLQHRTARARSPKSTQRETPRIRVHNKTHVRPPNRELQHCRSPDLTRQQVLQDASRPTTGSSPTASPRMVELAEANPTVAIVWRVRLQRTAHAARPALSEYVLVRSRHLSSPPAGWPLRIRHSHRRSLQSRRGSSVAEFFNESNHPLRHGGVVSRSFGITISASFTRF